MNRSTTPAHIRVLRRVDTQDPESCWIWQGSLRPNGYGAVARGRAGGGMVYAHRAVYEALVAPIPAGLVIDHLCRNRACVNPTHLEPVSRGENVLRGEGPSANAARRDACIHGHPYTPDNTYMYRGVRQCRTCRNRHRAAWRQRKADAA